MSIVCIILFLSFKGFAQIPTDSLKGYWSLDGNALDASGYNNNGQLQGGAVYCEDRFGVPNKAVKFGGFFNSSAIFVPNSPSLNLTAELTIAFWVKYDSISGMNSFGDYVDSLIPYGFYDNPRHCLIAKNGSNFFFENRFDTENLYILTAFFTYSNNGFGVRCNSRWIHVAMVVDVDTSLTFYRNGIKIHSSSIQVPQLPLANQNNLIFGRHENGMYPLNGRLDDIVYYNRALSPAEIQSLYNYPAAFPSVDTIRFVDYVNLGEVYTRNGFSLPAQNTAGIRTYARGNNCFDRLWLLELNVISPIEICEGDSVDLVADFLLGGDSAKLQWFKNGQIVAGAMDSVFTYFPVAGVDTIWCRLVSNENCVEPDTVFSQSIFVTTNPLRPVSVSISASDTSACSNTAVTFTVASLANGGTSPTYQWIKNGEDIPFATSDTYTDLSPADGDIITCRVVSDEVCPSPNTAVSDPITMNITPVQQPTIKIQRKR